jgi:multisubunit Na+/H+ antiporter MnhE subunit
MEPLLNYIEQVQYESRPLFYAALSLYVFLSKEITPIFFVCGVILAVCSFYVFKMRFVYRSRLMKR